MSKRTTERTSRIDEAVRNEFADVAAIAGALAPLVGEAAVRFHQAGEVLERANVCRGLEDDMVERVLRGYGFPPAFDALMDVASHVVFATDSMPDDPPAWLVNLRSKTT